MKVTIIYAYWPNQPHGATWCDLPWVVREGKLAQKLHEAGHEVRESILMTEGDFPEEVSRGFELAGAIAQEVKTARAEGELAVILCGSCTIAAVGGVAGLGDASTGIAWFDAHPDLHTPETTTSGLLEGMALACATGRAWRTMALTHAGLSDPASLQRTALFGARSIDEAEHSLMRDVAVPVCRSADEINARLGGAAATYVHVDMDVHDALAVRANSFAVPDGPSVDAVRDALRGIDSVAAVSVTGLDPAAADVDKAVEVAIGHVLALASARDAI